MGTVFLNEEELYLYREKTAADIAAFQRTAALLTSYPYRAESRRKGCRGRGDDCLQAATKGK